MTTPLIILAVLATVTGFLTFGGEFQTWVYGALPEAHAGKFQWHWGIFLGSTALALASGGAAFMFMHHRERVRQLGLGKIWPLPEARHFAERLFYLDDLGEKVLTRQLFYRGIARAAHEFDVRVVDGTVNAVWRDVMSVSGLVRFGQNGWVQAGTLAIGLGVIIIFAAVVLF